MFAASSLTNAFQELGAAFERSNPGVRVHFSLAGSSGLRTQLELGAQADVYASADIIQMDLARKSGVVASVSQFFATNELVVITPLGGDRVNGLRDLADPGLRLVLALPAVPVGAYARQFLQRMGGSAEFGSSFSERAMANVVSLETNVRQVVAKVALREADAGIAYATVTSQRLGGELTIIPIPGEYNVVAAYPAAVTYSARESALAQAFIDFLLSQHGQAILKQHGFGSPPP